MLTCLNLQKKRKSEAAADASTADVSMAVSEANDDDAEDKAVSFIFFLKNYLFANSDLTVFWMYTRLRRRPSDSRSSPRLKQQARTVTSQWTLTAARRAARSEKPSHRQTVLPTATRRSPKSPRRTSRFEALPISLFYQPSLLFGRSVPSCMHVFLRCCCVLFSWLSVHIYPSFG